MEKDIFCRIIEGKAPGRIVYQDDEVVAFWDSHPKAPIHILIVPRKHITSVCELTEQDALILGKMALAADKIARQEGIFNTGFRLVLNCGPDSGMIVSHLHMHLLGGKRLGGLVA
jgi:histidine triad (HIT) family protein